MAHVTPDELCANYHELRVKDAGMRVLIGESNKVPATIGSLKALFKPGAYSTTQYVYMPLLAWKSLEKKIEKLRNYKRADSSYARQHGLFGTFLRRSEQGFSGILLIVTRHAEKGHFHIHKETNT